MIAINARDVLIAGFLLLGGAIVVLQVAAVTGDRPIPTIGQVLSRIMRTRLAGSGSWPSGRGSDSTSSPAERAGGRPPRPQS